MSMYPMWILSNNKKNSEDSYLNQFHEIVSLQSLWQTSYTKGKVKRHIESVQKKDKYQCNQCEYKTEAQGPPNNHIESVNKKIKHNCNLCEYEAAENEHLQIHIISVHENLKHVWINVTNNLHRQLITGVKGFFSVKIKKSLGSHKSYNNIKHYYRKLVCL